MRTLKLVPAKTNITFIKHRNLAVGLSILLMLASIGVFFAKGLNFGIDFKGGTLIEASAEDPVDIGALRDRLNAMALGEVQIQEFGKDTDVLIRIAEAEGAIDASQDLTAVQVVRDELAQDFDIRRVEIVGPQVSAELIQTGILAVVVAISSMLIYIWFRFEWQFSVGAVLALVHDVVLTIGIFSLLQLDFNLSILAAILTIVGYSMNDTVVVYDRVRENLRKYKKMGLNELLDIAINETLSRTVMTSVTTLLALLALYGLGGEVIRGFTFAMIWGVIVGTYSSIFIASPLLMWLGVKRDWSGNQVN
ncbi:MAG: protein translocase subunit SecF [Rhodobiaceae bacterium]|jgi:preprotein translocase subunit SecF|nr:protein translocase subunit SecF [Rhodobiaceae bacterium]MBT5517941.1 protein translocase subunit SecF [Rhodobiaceae bacterium]MDG2496139.1 protein translocase subunit SecF [Alphaproteobacteria bacterium]